MLKFQTILNFLLVASKNQAFGKTFNGFYGHWFFRQNKALLQFFFLEMLLNFPLIFIINKYNGDKPFKAVCNLEMNSKLLGSKWNKVDN